MAAGYDPPERRNLLRTVRASFRSVLQDVLSAEQKDKFARFTQWLDLDTGDWQLEKALLAHAEKQRAELEDRPVLGIEPFTLGDVYIETECGILEWKKIRDDRVKPFDENSAPRTDLMSAVLDYMGRKAFNDAIVISGRSGSGEIDIH